MDITKKKKDIIAPILQIRKNEPETKKQNCKHKLVLLVNRISKLSKNHFGNINNRFERRRLEV